MNKRETKILYRANQILKKYKENTSIYFVELKKSLEEYRHLCNIDKTTKELYLTHIDTLNVFIMEQVHSKRNLILMCIFFFAMVGLTSYSTIRYYDLAKNIQMNQIKLNQDSILQIDYIDLENFNAIALAGEKDFQDLKPLKLKLTKKVDNLQQDVQYEIYLVEQNEEVEEENVIPRNSFLYQVKTDTNDTRIKSLKNSTIKNDKLLLYRGTMNDKQEIIEIRMWLDAATKDDALNKKYRFKLFVIGKL